jgi:PPP family 3-phenylpropionic acid transporter
MPAFYFLHFFNVGVFLPYLNIYFHSVGITPAQLGFLSAAARLSTSVAPPIAGAMADKLRRGREIMLAGVAVSSVIALAMWGVRSFWALLVLVTVYTAARGAVGPIAENISLREIEEHGGQYGRVRWWGSLGFIIAALGTGWLIDVYSIGLIFPIAFFGGIALIAVVFRFPREVSGIRGHFRGDLAKLLRSRPLLNFYGASMLMALSSGPFGLYFSIYLRELGMSAILIGMAWTLGVVSEIFFLVYAESIQRRIGLKAMITAGFFAAALRWELVSLTTSGVLLVGIQVLHGITFGVYHAAAVQYVDKLSGEAIRNTGQALYTAATFGGGAMIGVLLAGWLLPSLGFVRLMQAGAGLALAAGVWFAISSGVSRDADEVHAASRE